MNSIERKDVIVRAVDERQRSGRIQIAKDAMRFIFDQDIVLEDEQANRYAQVFGEAFEFLSTRLLSNTKET